MAFSRPESASVSKSIDIPNSQTGQSSNRSPQTITTKLMDKISMFSFSPDWKSVEAALHANTTNKSKR